MADDVETTPRRVRLLRPRLGITARWAGGHQTADVPAGTVGDIRGNWVTDDGHLCTGLLHLRVDVAGTVAHLPVSPTEIEEAAV